MARSYIFFLGLMLATAAASPTLAGEPMLDGLAEQVARLRGEIEVLDARLTEQKESRRAQVRALQSQKNALEMDLQREKLRGQQLSERMARNKERAGEVSTRQAAMKVALLESITRLRATIDSGIPFQAKDRAAQLDSIKSELESGALLPTAAIDRLWAWVDDELKLARESAVQQQAIVLEGEEVLADVVRIGLVAMYYSTPDGRLGYAKREASGWRFEPLTAAEERERALAMIAALEKHTGKGFVTVPGAALALAGGSR